MKQPTLVIDRSIWHNVTGRKGSTTVNLIFGFEKKQLEPCTKRQRQELMDKAFSLSTFGGITQYTAEKYISEVFMTPEGDETSPIIMDAVVHAYLYARVGVGNRKYLTYSSSDVEFNPGGYQVLGKPDGLFTIGIGNHPHTPDAREAFPAVLFATEHFVQEIVKVANELFDALVAHEQSQQHRGEMLVSPVYTCPMSHSGKDGSVSNVWVYLQRANRQLKPTNSYRVLVKNGDTHWEEEMPVQPVSQVITDQDE